MTKRILVTRDDISRMRIDAIVNAANNSLLGGGGVDGAIHKAAGSGLLEVCKLLNGCETGMAKITRGFKLPVNFIIHTVGPVWKGGTNGEAGLLASCYRECLKLATEHDCKTLAFPNISTGIYHFPKELAASIAIKEVREYLDHHQVPETVTFACFEEENFQIYTKLV